jgi:flavin reductase (DIM6/NTAB) family NADH-FMN oxidoreductase RutF
MSELRKAPGRFATGVTVVGTSCDGEIHAMPANAFTSVSLEPPLILVPIDRRARMHGLLPRTRAFTVPEHADAAWHFAGRPCLEHDPFEDGAIARLECSLYATVDAGDHTLYLGLVEALDRAPGEPLLFHDGAFSTR